MEASHEEFVGSSNENYNNQARNMIAEGKQTKRQRPSSPLISSSLSSGRGEEDGNSFSSPTTSGGGGEVYESTEEEEDMAYCLILLAQGNYRPRQPQQQEIAEGRKLNTSNPSTNKAGLYVYECKTCNRTFPSFQALGGHRASYKKPKAAAVVDDKKPTFVPEELEDNQQHTFPFNKNLQKLRISAITTTNKVHECSICGSEFTSGQALGGHMRRHRAAAPIPPNLSTIMSSVVVSRDSTSASPFSAATMTTNDSPSSDDAIEIKRERPNILSLDLNLPAPEDDHRSVTESKSTPRFLRPGFGRLSLLTR